MSFFKDNYKFKSLKVYSSDEWMGNETKRYRSVFDKSELSYVRVELALYNKAFDEYDWICKVEFKIFKIENSGKKELCKLDDETEASKNDPVIFVRNGWGVSVAGDYWVEGEYVWEAFIGGTLIGSQTFFVNDVGPVSPERNPYFEVKEIKFYCGNHEGWKLENRKYLTTINQKTTEYLWCEVKLKNNTASAWQYELFFNFYDSTGQLKALVMRNNKIAEGKLSYSYTFDIGWGNHVAGTWKNGEYTLILGFMGVVAGMASFNCGDNEVEGVTEFISLPASAFITGKQNKTK